MIIRYHGLCDVISAQRTAIIHGSTVGSRNVNSPRSVLIFFKNIMPDIFCSKVLNFSVISNSGILKKLFACKNDIQIYSNFFLKITNFCWLKV